MGESDRALEILQSIQHLRAEGGMYWTGYVFEDDGRLAGGADHLDRGVAAARGGRAGRRRGDHARSSAGSGCRAGWTRTAATSSECAAARCGR